MLRTTITRSVFRSSFVARSFSTSPIARKTVVDTAKDTLKKADRTVSDTLVKGIDKGGMFAVSLFSSIWVVV